MGNKLYNVTFYLKGGRELNCWVEAKDEDCAAWAAFNYQQKDILGGVLVIVTSENIKHFVIVDQVISIAVKGE